MLLPIFTADVPRAPGGAERILAAYRDTGLVIVRDVVPKDRLAELTTRLLEAFADARRSGRLFDGGGLVAGHINCFPGEASRFAYDALEQNGILDLVRALSPAFLTAVRVGCNLNFPNSVAQNWHIDGAFAREFAIVNVAVVDTDEVNGATDVLPGSHKVAQPYWRMALADAFKDNARPELRRGDVMIRTSRLWHRGMPNHSAVARPMLGFTFGESTAPSGDPFETEGGGIVFAPNRFKTNSLGMLRERSYVVVPSVHHALRLVRSLLGKDGYA